MTAVTDLSMVIDNGWCIGCGVCAIVDESVTLTLDPDKLMYQPSGVANADAAKVCPAVKVDYERLHDELFPGADVTEYGVVESVVLAQSTNHQRNLKASSGGLIKEILRYMLETGEVDGVITLQHVAGLDFQPGLVTETAEVDDLPGSIYHSLDQSEALRILKDRPGRYVLVSIPCHLEGIYQYILEFEPDLQDRIALTVGLLCGWQYSHHSIEAMGAYLGYDPSQIADISFRGDGPVGKLRVRLHDGKEVSSSRRINFSYQVAFDRHFNVPRCHVCINHSNFLADIVIGDAWLPSTVKTQTGISLVISRRPKTREMLSDLEAQGRIILTEVGVEEIRESQTDRVIFGDFAYAYADYLEEQKIPHPQLIGPNSDRANRRDRGEVERFHSELHTKLDLQRARRYRRLWWRKATIEAPRLAKRYLIWFGVRILRLKSLTRKRTEVARSELRHFR